MQPKHSSEAISTRRNSDIPSLSMVRGVLALWVVLYHFWPDVLALFPIWSLLTPMMTKGQFAVPAFFILSGVVLAYNYGDSFKQFSIGAAVSFLINRFARIYPVHLASLLVVLAMVTVSWNRGWEVADSGYTLRDFILNLFLVHTWVPHFTLNWNYPSWSISSEWFAYMLFVPLMATCYRLSSSWLWGGAVCSYAAMLWVYNSPPETLFRELLVVVPTFLFGVIFTHAWRLDRTDSVARQTSGSSMTVSA